MLMMPMVALLFVAALDPAEPRTVTVSFRDEKGAAVPGLSAEEVVVLENGVAREVTRLEPDGRRLNLAVLVDSSEPVGSVYRLNLVEAVVRFLGRLPEGSRYALWTTGDRPTKVVDFTTDVTEAGKALKRVYPQGGNTLLDALVEASRELKKREGERLAVVSVTGLGIGFSNWDRQHVVDLVQDGVTSFLAVQFDEGRGPTGGRAEGQVGASDYEYVLSELARGSGGLHETTLSAMGVEQALQKVAAELRGQYRLTYAGLPDVKERKLEVKVARPGVKARVGRALGQGR